jgi:hypothetical protein
LAALLIAIRGLAHDLLVLLHLLQQLVRDRLGDLYQEGDGSARTLLLRREIWKVDSLSRADWR